VRPDGTTNVLGIATKINRLVRTEDRLEHERHLLRQLMENIPDAIYFKDAHSKFTFINQALAESLGLDKPDDAKGKSDHDFFPPDYAAQAVAEEKEILKTGTPLRNKLALTRSPTGVRWRLTTKAPIMSTAGDDPVGIVGISRDITELRRAEEEAQKQTQIARRNAVWQDASNSIAHKLGIVRDAARIAEQKSVIVDLPQEDFEIPADAQKLADCFDELFENSLRWFDKVPWTVKITAELVEHPRIPSVLDPKSPYLRLRYHDNGPGIQNSEKDRIFSPYVKRTKKGLGLGLALTQECITAHGGFIEETGKLGEGARFDIYLPATTKPTNTRQHEYSSIS
jgi:PAS domain S-box-containing protein